MLLSVRRAVENTKKRKLIAPTTAGGKVGYPEEYARYRQQGRFGDAPDKPKASGAGQKSQGKTGADTQPEVHLDPQEAAKDRALEETRLKHEERVTLIQQGINPDSMQPFAEESQARQMLLELLQQQESEQDAEGSAGLWSERDFIKREDLLKRSAIPGAKVGRQSQFGKTQFKEMHLCPACL